MTIPSPGPSVDFTTNHKQMQDALNNIKGNGESERGRFNISTYEALALAERARQVDGHQRMLSGCAGHRSVSSWGLRPRREHDAVQMAQRIRIQTTESVVCAGRASAESRGSRRLEVAGPAQPGIDSGRIAV